MAPLRRVRGNLSRLDAGEGDQDHRIVEAGLGTTYICNLCDSSHLSRRPYSLKLLPRSAWRRGLYEHLSATGSLRWEQRLERLGSS
jgi:hypothetical protein